MTIRWFSVCVFSAALVSGTVACSQAQPAAPAIQPAPAVPEAPAEVARVASSLAPPAATVPPAGQPLPLGGAPPAVAAATPGAGGASGGRVAVVILMLPEGAEDRAHRGDPRTYKLSMTADLSNATVEVDGRPVGSAQVQRVYPRERDRYAVRLPPDALGVRDGTSPAEDDLAARQKRRAATTTATVAPARPMFLNPNGAPIID